MIADLGASKSSEVPEMGRFPGMLLVAVSLFAMLLATSASAQPVSERKSSSTDGSAMKVDGTGPSYTVQFVDDPLNALNDGVLIPRIVVRPGAVRTMLLRPRGSFVTEMLKSVETL